MSPELLLGLAAILAAVALLIRSFATHNSAETTRDALVTSLAAKYDSLSEKQYASLLREIAIEKDKANAIAQLASVQAKLDMALSELLIVKAQLKVANEQITRLRNELNVERAPGDVSINADKHDEMKATDAASAVTAVPEIGSGVGVSLVGTMTVTPQEVPPLPPTPGPIGIVDAETGKELKIA